MREGGRVGAKRLLFLPAVIAKMGFERLHKPLSIRQCLQ